MIQAAHHTFETAERLIAQGHMHAAGLAQLEAARSDGKKRMAELLAMLARGESP